MAMTLREARLRKKLTQDDLAAKSGVDQTHISNIEIGRRQPSDDVKERLAKALGIAPSKLRFQEPQPDATVNHTDDRVGQTDPSDSVVPTHREARR